MIFRNKQDELIYLMQTHKINNAKAVLDSLSRFTDSELESLILQIRKGKEKLVLRNFAKKQSTVSPDEAAKKELKELKKHLVVTAIKYMEKNGLDESKIELMDESLGQKSEKK